MVASIIKKMERSEGSSSAASGHVSATAPRRRKVSTLFQAKASSSDSCAAVPATVLIATLKGYTGRSA